MAVVTYLELKTEIAQKLNNTGLEPQIATAINRTLELIKKDRFWFNERRETVVLTTGDPLVPLPSDFLFEIQGEGLTINYAQSRYPLWKVSSRYYDSINVQSQGLPNCYCATADSVQGGLLKVYFYPDQNYDLEIYYLKDYEALVNDTDENDFTNFATRLMVARTLADLYVDQRESPEMYERYLSIANLEWDALVDRTRGKTATGYLTTENIQNGDEFYGSRYL